MSEAHSASVAASLAGMPLKFHYLFCYWPTCCSSHKVSITPPLCWTVHPFTGRCGAGLSGPGPAVPALLFHLPVLPAEQKRGAAQRRLLLHGLVCHYCNACLQVSTNTGSAARFSSCIINVCCFALRPGRQRHREKARHQATTDWTLSVLWWALHKRKSYRKGRC